MKRLGLVSVHTCPLAALGGKETGGMNVYVRETARHLGRLGFEVDVFTRSQDPSVPQVVALGDGARVIHIEAGPRRAMSAAAMATHLDAFADGVDAFRHEHGADYALLHAHYWLSGVVALDLARRWGETPVVQMFHTLGVRAPGWVWTPSGCCSSWAGPLRSRASRACCVRSRGSEPMAFARPGSVW